MADDAAHAVRSTQTSELANDQFTFADLFRFQRLYRVSIILCTIVPLAIASGYIVKTPPTYRARVQLLLDPRTPEPLTSQMNEAGRTLDSAYVQSQVAVLRSEKIAMAVIDKLKLLEDEEFLEEGERRAKGRSDFMTSRLAIYRLDKNLDVRRSGTSYAIDINYDSGDPEKAALIANTLARAFVDDQINARAESVREGSQWLEERIEALRRQMNNSALRVQNFRAKRDYRIANRSGLDKSSSEPPAFKAAVDDASAPSRTSDQGNGRPIETLEELESTAQTYRRIYESYLQAYTDSLQRQSLPMTNVRIITPATRPLSPSAPKKTLILAFALLVGLIVGLGQALLRYNFMRSSRRSQPDARWDGATN
ncbi:MAG: GNVR domain-containing protein [Hyphomicrobiaceae bacterium]